VPEDKSEEITQGSKARNIDDLLKKREELESLLDSEFKKVVTVMFTDMKGSTAMTEARGDMATRALLKSHNEIVFAGIANNNGKLVKTMGDGTLSWFKNVEDAIRAAISMQRALDAYNLKKSSKREMIIIRVGIHTGECILEEDDLYGDVVNTASRIESSAQGAEIYISESSFEKVKNKNEFYSRFAKAAELKGKSEPLRLNKIFWNPVEIEADKKKPVDLESMARREEPKKNLKFFIMVILAPLLLVALLALINYINNSQSFNKERSLRHSVDIEVEGK